MSKPTNRDDDTDDVALQLRELIELSDMKLIFCSEHADNYQRIWIEHLGQEFRITIEKA